MPKLRLMFSLLLFPLTISANDEANNAVFPGLPYPIEAASKADEKAGEIYQTPYSLPAKYDFNTVIIQGETDASGLQAELSLKDSPAGFYGYKIKPLFFSMHKNGRFWAKFHLNKTTRNSFSITLTGRESSKSFSLTIYEVQSFKEELLKEIPEISTFVYVPDPALSVPQDVTFKILRREDWQALPPKEPYLPHTPRAITIHHTAGKYTATLNESLAEIQFIQDYHQNAKGWIDIGYHFVVDSQGNIFEGRPFKAVGAHVLGRNTDNIGISVMGNYHPPKNDQISTNTITAIVSIARYLEENYSVNESSFYAHRDIGKTDCPGDLLYARMPELKKLIFENNPGNLNVLELDWGTAFEKSDLLKKTRNNSKNPAMFR